MIKKIIILVVAVAVTFGGSISAYSWWDTLQEQQVEELTIGEGTDLILAVNATAPVGKVLVPSGVVMGVNDVDEIVLSYDINLSKEAQNDLELNVVVSELLINGNVANISLVNISVTPSTVDINDNVVTITVTVSIDEPLTEAIYNDIANGDITFNLTFNAS